MTESKCRTEQELSDYILGRLAAGLVDEVDRHIEECQDCQSTIVMLGDQSDTFVDGLRERPAEDSLEMEAEGWLARIAVDRRGSDRTLEQSAADRLGRIGPYKIVGRVGVGGMGTVFAAVHSKLKRTVALKILPASRWANAAAIARFEREMEVIGQLDHPNIVRASDAGEENGMHYLVMEHVEGLDLSRLVHRLGPLPVADVCEIGRQAAIGLQYAHEQHLVHRDIKPSNLMLQQGRSAATARPTSDPPVLVKILDLGLALLGEEHAGRENELTTVGQLMGTLDYMSPEQGMDSHDVDTRSDIYSLGATLYKLLSGQAPFSGPQYNTLLKKVTALANRPSPSIRDVRPDLPLPVAAIIDRMLAKDPEQRPSSPREVAEALAPLARGADLQQLLERGIAAPDPADEQPTPITPVAAVGVPPRQVVKPATANAPESTAQAWMIGLSVVLLLLGAISTAVVVYLATDRGELVVSAADDAQIRIRQDGKTVDELQVHQGQNSIRVRSGQYIVELQGKSDQLQLSRQTVAIRRGEREIVRVERRPAETAAAGTAATADPEAEAAWDAMWGAGDAATVGANQPVRARPEPTYDGKTYSQWLSDLETERKPESLTEAINAFATLGEEDSELAAQSAAAILRIMRRYGSRIIYGGPRGRLIMKAQEILLQMPPAVVVAALCDEIENGTSRSRAFANFFLASPLHAGDAVGANEFAWALRQGDDRLLRLLVELPESEVPSTRGDALSSAIRLAQLRGMTLSEVEGLLPRLRRGLESSDLAMLAAATSGILAAEPENELLVPALIRRISPKDPFGTIDGLVKLGQLGPQAKLAVGALVGVLKTLVNPNESNGMIYAGNPGGMGGMMGGVYSSRTDAYYMAIQTLGKIGPGAESALPVLRGILESGSSMGGGGHEMILARYKEVAAEAIGTISGQPVEVPQSGLGGMGQGGGF